MVVCKMEAQLEHTIHIAYAHIFAHLALISVLSRCLVTKIICASELSRKLIKSALLLVGFYFEEEHTIFSCLLLTPSMLDAPVAATTWRQLPQAPSQAALEAIHDVW